VPRWGKGYYPPRLRTRLPASGFGWPPTGLLHTTVPASIRRRKPSEGSQAGEGGGPPTLKPAGLGLGTRCGNREGHQDCNQASGGTRDGRQPHSAV